MPRVTDQSIAELGPWFHNLHLPDGTQTAPDHPLGDFPSFKWAQLSQHLPEDLRGWSALDVGCNAGFYSFDGIMFDTSGDTGTMSGWPWFIASSIRSLEVIRVSLN